MAKIALITEKQYRPGINEVGDIVGVFNDDHSFTAKELADFNIVQVELDKATVELIPPQVKTVFKSATTEWTDIEPDTKRTWRDSSGNWNEIVKDPKYKLRYDKGQIKENYSRSVENLSTTIMVDKIG